jgi:cholesterol oxidase
MSDDKNEGVVNEYGEVWNYPNLYVSDGSIIPTALSVNPSATISALSERIAEHLVVSG